MTSPRPPGSMAHMDAMPTAAQRATPPTDAVTLGTLVDQLTAARRQTIPHLRRRLAAAMREIGAPESDVDRVMRCGTTGHVAWTIRGGEPRIAWRPHYCEHRACPDPSCQRSRIQRQRDRYTEMGADDLLAGRRLRMMTLTYPGEAGMSYRDARERLWSAWRRLRRSAAWRTHMPDAGGVTSEEATWSQHGPDDPGHYHTHLHVAVGGGHYWPVLGPARDEEGRHDCDAHPCDGGRHLPRAQRHEPRTNCPTCRCLSCAWRHATRGDAYIVDLRAAYDADGQTAATAREEARAIAKEAVKYAAKVWTLPSAQWADWLRGIAGARLRQPWGTWYGRATRAVDRPADAPTTVADLAAATSAPSIADAPSVIVPDHWTEYVSPGDHGTWALEASEDGYARLRVGPRRAARALAEAWLERARTHAREEAAILDTDRRRRLRAARRLMRARARARPARVH